MHVIINKKGIIFNIAYGEMHECLAWKRKTSLNSFGNGFHGLWYYLEILKMLYINLYYLGNLCKIFMIRNGFANFENTVDIWLLKYFMKLLESELCILNTLACELLMWFCHCALILVIILSVWRPCLCDDPVCVMTHLCDDPICVMTLSFGLGWGFWFWNDIRYFDGS